MLAERRENSAATSKSLTTNLKNFVPIGWVKKAHGLKGELLLSFDSGESPGPAKVFYFKETSKKTSFKPFKVLKMRPTPKGFLVLFENFKTRNEALNLVGMRAYLDKKHFSSKKGEKIYLCELLGFDIYSGDKKIGRIDHFLSHDLQDLAVIKARSNLLIPFVPDFTRSIDFNQKKIKMELPEGLI